MTSPDLTPGNPPNNMGELVELLERLGSELDGLLSIAEGMDLTPEQLAELDRAVESYGKVEGSTGDEFRRLERESI